jgi:large subunit ribosomal protein L21e
VRGRIIRKRIHVRIEHIQPSRCRADFLKRREDNDAIKHEAKVKGGEKTSLRRSYASLGRASMLRHDANYWRVLLC